MKLLFLVAAIGSVQIISAQSHYLEKLWETDSAVAVPESVLPVGNTLYVSLIDGGGWDADGKGGVARLGLDGKNYMADWITGLNAPKGLGIAGNRLYVADISNIVVIDVARGTIEKKIPIDSAKGLNDITITDKGVVYVSDSRTARIWRIENNIASLYLENMKGVNGLRAIGNDLIIASGKLLVKADAQKQLTTIAELPQGGDGIEPVGNGDYIVSAWSGSIWYVHADGRIETLLETYQQKKNTADIGYDPVNQILYVPTFNGRTVAAYRLL
ncbi:ATP-binding protein [Terrimonas pollutisoli]|uniref:ATP-binding protein n=1 Tax=Terrimonas pollutisoli TaxID=3034147 RepID=UPI0023EB13AC|nr:ATP-binding protein [Terrimonas sp. H1YJ31]